MSAFRFEFRSRSLKSMGVFFSYCTHTSLRGYTSAFWGIWTLTYLNSRPSAIINCTMLDIWQLLFPEQLWETSHIAHTHPLPLGGVDLGFKNFDLLNSQPWITFHMPDVLQTVPDSQTITIKISAQSNSNGRPSAIILALICLISCKSCQLAKSLLACKSCQLAKSLLQ